MLHLAWLACWLLCSSICVRLAVSAWLLITYKHITFVQCLPGSGQDLKSLSGQQLIDFLTCDVWGLAELQWPLVHAHLWVLPLMKLRFLRVHCPNSVMHSNWICFARRNSDIIVLAWTPPDYDPSMIYAILNNSSLNVNHEHTNMDTV